MLSPISFSRFLFIASFLFLLIIPQSLCLHLTHHSHSYLDFTNTHLHFSHLPKPSHNYWLTPIKPFLKPINSQSFVPPDENNNQNMQDNQNKRKQNKVDNDISFTGSQPFQDKNWNYCDVKCLSFQHLLPGADFFVATFRKNQLSPAISACYGYSAPSSSPSRSSGPPSPSSTQYSPKLWNELIQNDFYEKLCGSEDNQNYFTDWNDGYGVVFQEGIGIGNLIIY